MNKILSYAVLATTVMAGTLNLSAREREVPLIAGTLLQCTLNEPNLSSRTAKTGEPLVCYARPLSEFGCSMFPRGTELAGRFVEAKEPGRLVGKGWIQLQFERLVFADGEAPIAARVISARGFRVDSEGRILGRGHAKRDAVGWSIPVLWPIKVATLPMRGPRPTLKGERVLILRLLEDIRIPCRGFGADEPRLGWHYFGSPDGKSSESFRPESGDAVLGSLSKGGRTSGTVVSSGYERDVANDGRPLVIESGHHQLLIGSSLP
jgi:hypothetical protein